MKTETKLIHFSEGIELESGEKLNSFDLMVETYGELNEGKSNEFSFSPDSSSIPSEK